MKKYDATDILYISRNNLSFSSIHKYFSLLLIFKSTRHNSNFEFRENPCHTRSNVNFSLPVVRTTLSENNVINYGPELFSSLTHDVEILLIKNTFNKYKNERKIFFLSVQT